MRILLCCLMLLLIAITCVHSAETRGLHVIAKDLATGQQGEVKLYNKSYAVIIGIDKYPNLPPDKQLSYAVRDAQGIEQVLRKQYKFDKIVTLYNEQATRTGIVRLLTTELSREMGSDDSLFIFWAGHGNQESSPDGDIGYLIPYDGVLDDISSAVTMSEIRDTISKKIPAKHVFYAMDACYSGLLTTRAIDPKVRRDLGYLREITKERVRQILTAGSKGQEVLDGGPKGHSVFTGRLIEVLEATGDFITANEIQAILKEKVFGDAKGRGHNQTPGFGTLSGNGDFVFVPSKEYLLEERRAEQGRIQQDIEKSRKEQEKIQRELAELESLEQKAKQASNDRELHKAEAARQSAEAKLTLERLNQQKLEEEKQRKSLDEAELVKLEQERQKQLESARQLEVRLRQDDEQRASDLSRLEREQLITRQQEEQKVALLRTQAEERRKKSLVVAGSLSLDAAVAEIKSTSARIDEINKEFAAELAQQNAAAEQRRQEKLAILKQNYDKQIVTLQQQTSTPLVVHKTIVSPKDEFETGVEYRDRVAKAEKVDKERTAEAQAARDKVLETEQSAYNRLVDQVESAYHEDIRTQKQRIVETREGTVKALKVRMAVLAKQEFTLSAESLELSVGQYDAEMQVFPISINSKPTGNIKVAVNGTFLLPKTSAREFKQHYSSGLVRPEVTVIAASGRISHIAFVDEATIDFMRVYYDGEYIAVVEMEKRLESVRKAVGEMVALKGGCFQMGDTFDGGDKSANKVCVGDFKMGKYEVTQGQWKEVMGNNPSSYSLCGDDCPVEQVSWDDVQAFIRKLNSRFGKEYRLPTEAEWEFAARSGGEQEKYSGGNDIDVVAWYDANSGKKTHPVGQKLANGLALYDMSGNVWEWVNDMYENKDPVKADTTLTLNASTSSARKNMKPVPILKSDRAEYVEICPDVSKGGKKTFCEEINNYYPREAQNSGSHRVVRGGGWDNSNSRLIKTNLH